MLAAWLLYLTVTCVLAIHLIQIIVDYDKDKRVGALGFGAILPGGAEASHCFALTGSPTQTEVDGVDGLLKAYAESRQIVKLYGPTNFEPVISHVSMMAKECRKRAYHVLIILTGRRTSIGLF